MLRQTSLAPSGATVRRADCALTQSADAGADAEHVLLRLVAYFSSHCAHPRAIRQAKNHGLPANCCKLVLVKCPYSGVPMAQRILIISPAWLGDIIMSQSLLKTLKQRDPSCEITLYAPQYAHAIIARMPEVDHLIVNPFAHGALQLGARYAEGQKLKAQHFDCAYILPNSLKSALVPFFAGIKERIGLKGESRYLLINRMRCDKHNFPRMVERYVALAYVDNPSIKSAADLPEFAYPQLTLEPPSAELLARLGLKARPLIALGCGANYGPAKLWPVEYFAAASAHFIRHGYGILALGTDKDKATVAAIKAALMTEEQAPNELAPHFYDIAGRTNLTEALDLVGTCRGAICNDSGLMHTVAAAGVPQVCLFGSTSTGYTPPLSAQALCLESTQPCHPCFKRTCQLGTYQCLKELTPERAIAALSRLLGEDEP